MKHLLLAVGGAAVLMSAALGVTYAQSTQTPTPAPTQTSAQQRRQAIISDTASQLGVSADQLQQALVQARKDVGGQPRPLASLRREELQVAVKAIGLPDVKTLRTQLAGSTLTAVAQSHNVQPSTVSTAIMADITSKLQADVTSGQINANQVQTLTQRAQNRVNALMTHQFPARSTA
jgi:transposase-like protein